MPVRQTSVDYLPPRNQRPCIDYSILPENQRSSVHCYPDSRNPSYSRRRSSLPRNQPLCKDSPQRDSIYCMDPTLSSHQAAPISNAIYSNVKRLKPKVQCESRPHKKQTPVQSPRRSLRLMSKSSWDIKRSLPPYGPVSVSDLWLPGSSASFPEDVTPLWPHRSNTMGSPDAHHITVNPMYDRKSPWALAQREPRM
ncbi:hypothetical protein GDO86_017902 [Hymenochirus boettgeri]|uniref:Uncharacterized protein n=1 Tax=Hymenochirus boettgeri TaxID=247094 RepID=A0A8T2IBF1_9PIPI|nr:hypothetical protein GDO86_017902 [Hymenochirus boettgeri]